MDSTRKFEPELLETSFRSLSAKQIQQQDGQLHVEEEEKSGLQQDDRPTPNHDLPTPPSSTSASPPPLPPPALAKPRRFLPLVVETMSTEHRGGSNDAANENASTNPGHDSSGSTQNTTKRFRPQLIETAKGSFRQPNATRAPNSSATAESRFSYASLRRRQEGGRRPSFQVPTLPAIGSSDASPTSPGSPISTDPTIFSDAGAPHRDGNGTLQQVSSRERLHSNASISDRDLAAVRKAAEFMRDRALAAFPNEQVHQPVAHFAIDNEDDEEEQALKELREKVNIFRRGSTVDLLYELEELARHKEESEMRARERLFAEAYRVSSAVPENRRFYDTDPSDYDVSGSWEEDEGIVYLKRATSPPMLGQDIEFVRCQSPDQLSSGRSSPEIERDPRGLRKITEGSAAHLWVPRRPSHDENEPGLWHGYCKETDHEDRDQRGRSAHPAWSKLLTTIVTPGIHEEGKQLALQTGIVPVVQPSLRPTTPEGGRRGHVERQLDERIQHEFDDKFVTQLYNYLAFGYPCIAREYDEELSKITGIPVEELRQDDASQGATGYVGIDQSSNIEGKCHRWFALKAYVHEWARQQPRSTDPENPLGPWSGIVRRGSWGV
jgi:hypothetical protein